MKPRGVEELGKKLGFSSSQLKQLHDGAVVSNELEASSDKDLSLTFAVVVGADLDKTWDFLQAERVSEIQTATVSDGKILPTDISLDDMELDEETVKKLEGDPAGLFFLSKDEKKKMKDGAKAGKAVETLKEILVERANAYWEKGLGGIIPYEGKGRDPAIDLAAANKAMEHIIVDPTLKAAIETIPSQASDASLHSMSWSIQKGRDLATPTLNHLIRFKKDGVGILSVTRKFYSGYDYDSSQIVSGAIPTADGRTAIFYTNHTYTSQVAGFGGGAKRSIGRKMMKGKLTETMEKAQKALVS